jgi:hypothetical protein
MWRKWVFLLLAIAVFSGGGCGRSKPPLGTIHGHVTLRHHPLSENAYVMLSNPESGVAMTAMLAADGSYEVKTYQGRGLPPGRYLVTIVPRQNLPVDQPLTIMPPSGTKPPPLQTMIPARYYKASTSGLSINVSTGENPPFDFELSP